VGSGAGYRLDVLCGVVKSQLLSHVELGFLHLLEGFGFDLVGTRSRDGCRFSHVVRSTTSARADLEFRSLEF